MADGTTAAIAALAAAHPDLRISKVGGSIDYTIEQYEGSMTMIYEGAALAIIVVWLFLRDWRATLISATALPLSILPTFAAMQWLGYTLNSLTLLALAAVIGILVDDAIVEVENIERHRRMGKPVLEATEEAVNEIAMAVIATTMTLVAVFLPTALMSGFAGLIFAPFGWTAVIAVLASLLVARLLTPMMAAHFLKPGAEHESGDGRITQVYLRAVEWCLGHRTVTAALTLLFLAGSIALVPLLPTGFLPPDNRSLTELSFELAPGSALEDTGRVGAQVHRIASAIEGVDRVFVSIGQAGDGDDMVSGARRGSATLLLTLQYATDQDGDRGGAAREARPNSRRAICDRRFRVEPATHARRQ